MIATKDRLTLTVQINHSTRYCLARCFVSCHRRIGIGMGILSVKYSSFCVRQIIGAGDASPELLHWKEASSLAIILSLSRSGFAYLVLRIHLSMCGPCNALCRPDLIHWLNALASHSAEHSSTRRIVRSVSFQDNSSTGITLQNGLLLC